VNDDQIGEILRYALSRRCVRGVTLQPVQDAGRNEDFAPDSHRLTLSEVRRKVLEQCDLFAPEDVLPVPCHPDCLAMAYAIKHEGTVTPLTRYVDPKLLIEGGRNTIVYEGDRALTGAFVKHLFDTFST